MWRSCLSGLLLVGLLGCAANKKPRSAAGLPPPPVLTYTADDAEEGQRIEHGELIIDVDEERRKLHAQHHPHGVLEIRKLPPKFTAPAMDSVGDFALAQRDLVQINPGPGEYVSVMEGQRHGYQNLTVGITYTAPGGAPPMHTHEGEEAHVLLEGKILYALGDDVAELVVIFPTNVWEYDVLDYFPFSDE